jgi:hypothetical protein
MRERVVVVAVVVVTWSGWWVATNQPVSASVAGGTSGNSGGRCAMGRMREMVAVAVAAASQSVNMSVATPHGAGGVCVRVRVRVTVAVVVSGRQVTASWSVSMCAAGRAPA